VEDGTWRKAPRRTPETGTSRLDPVEPPSAPAPVALSAAGSIDRPQLVTNDSRIA
jgi:hypothetical protein